MHPAGDSTYCFSMLWCQTSCIPSALSQEKYMTQKDFIALYQVLFYQVLVGTDADTTKIRAVTANS